MKNSKQWLGSLAAVSLLLTGCAAAAGTVDAGTSDAGAAAPAAVRPVASAPASPPDASDGPSEEHSGGHHGTESSAPAEDGDTGPSDAAAMVCGQQTKDNISAILDLNAAPHTVTNWADKVFTCTYHLAEGPLVISVKESADPTSARNYFDALKSEVGDSTPIKGLANLGFPAYQTDDGSVVFLKDNMTLHVNATDLPPAVGPDSIAPTSFAYQTATTILACWKEHP